MNLKSYFFVRGFSYSFFEVISIDSSNQPKLSDDLTTLVDLYKVVLEEYRFQVNLNWDRNKFYVLLNSGLISANCGLLRLPGFKFAEFLTIPLFFLGFLTAYLGYQTLNKGIEYRRRASIKKAEMEQRLGEYSDFIPVETTAGMRDLQKMVRDQDALESYVTKAPRLGTINYFLTILFVSLMGTNAIAIIYLITKLITAES